MIIRVAPINPELSEYEIIFDDLTFKAQFVACTTPRRCPWAAFHLACQYTRQETRAVF